MAETIAVLLDTDIGTDVDDAVCLAYLLRQPRCELVGVTTVTGEAPKRAMLASALCQAAGRADVPVHSGVETPLLIPQYQLKAQQAVKLDRWPHREDFERNAAVEFMRQTIRSRPGEITLVAVGPMTNVGLLFALDREIPSLLKHFVHMGGSYLGMSGSRGLKEWNIAGDPHSAAIVYGASVQGHLSVGLDVTQRCNLSDEESRRRFRGDTLLECVADFAEVWFEQWPGITFHDPLTAALVFEPGLCQYERGRVEVELTSDRAMGMTHWTQDGESRPHQIAVDVNVGGLFEHYFATVRSS